MSSPAATTDASAAAAASPAIVFTPERLVKFVLRALEWHTMLVNANKKENLDPLTPFAIARALALGGLCDPGCMVPPLWCDLGLTKTESQALMEQINKCMCRYPCPPDASTSWNALLYNSWYNNNTHTPSSASNMLQKIVAQQPGYCLPMAGYPACAPTGMVCGFPALNLPQSSGKKKCKK